MNPLIALISVIALSVQFGLAILGMGGFSRFFAHPALIALAAVGTILTGCALFSEGNLSAGEREERSNRWVLIAFGVLALLIAYVPAYTDRTGLLTVDGETIRWIGVAIGAAGGALRLWPVFVLGKRFSGLVAIQPGHRLVTTGIYSVIRNPSYLGLLISALGWALAFRSLIGVALALLNLIPLIARIHAEEALLRATFGAEYAAYCARTWRLVPGLY